MSATIETVMTRDVEFVHPSDTLRVAAEKMRSLNVGPMPVCDEDKLLGMITDRDIVVRAIALGHNPDSATVADAMTDEVHTVKPDASLEEAAQLMKEYQVRRLLVVNDEQRLIGIVSLGDLSQESGDVLAGETLERISEPAAPNM